MLRRARKTARPVLSPEPRVAIEAEIRDLSSLVRIMEMREVSEEAEQSRLETLRRYSVPAVTPEEPFDRITRLAVRASGAEAAFLYLIDEDRAWPVSCFGAEAYVLDRRHALCERVLERERAFVLDGASGAGGRAPILHVDGSSDTHPIAAAPLRTEEGFCIGMLGVIYEPGSGCPAGVLETLEDLAAVVMGELERRRERIAHRDAEAAILQREQRWRSLFEQAGDAVFLTRLGGTFCEANEAACRMTGYSRDELRTMRPEDLITGRHLHAHPIDWNRLASGATFCLERELRRKDGTTLLAEISHRVFDGEHVTSIIRDISDRRAAEQQIRESEARLRMVIENMPVVLSALDADGTFILSEGRGLDALALAPGEVVGRSVFDIYRDEPDLLMTLRRALQGEAIHEALTLNGRTYEVLFTPVRDEQGHFSHTIGLALDVTDRHEAERALASEKAFVDGALDALPEIFFVFDERGRIIRWNRSIETITGYTREEFLAVNPLRLFGGDDRRRIVEALHRILRGERVTVEAELCTKSGRRIPFEFSGSRLEDPVAGFMGACGIGRDVSWRKEAEAALHEREAFLESIVENIPLQVFVKDARDLRFVRMNRAGEALLGISRTELVGRSDYDFFPDEEADFFTAQDRRVLTSRMLVDIPEETIHTRRSGPRTLRTKKIPILDADGVPRYLLGISEDITEWKQAQEALRLSGARYYALSRLIQAYGYSLRVGSDGEPEIEWVTDSVEEILGYAPGEVTWARWLATIHPDDVPSYDAYRAELRQNRPACGEFRVRTRSGDVRWVRSMCFPEWDEENGCIVRYYGAGQDITWQKEIEAELIDARDRAEEMNRLKTVFLANMSHEIRTPLTAIIGFADVLSGEVSDAGKEFARLIRTSGERLLSTLNSVLDLAQIESRRLRLNLEPIDVPEQARQVLDLFSMWAEQQGTELRLEAPAALVTKTDRGALDRVLQNLVSNAIKFTRGGRVVVSVEARRGEVVLEVRDTGIGISPAFLPHVFDEFRQESEGLTRGYEGSGLGLAITKRLVDMLGGSIAVESQQNAGTTFTVRFPHEAAAISGDGRPGAVETVRLGGRRRVLVIDDDPNVHLLVHSMLRDRHLVETVTDEAEALERAAGSVFDIVLLDINLRESRSGPDVLAALRTLPGYERVPVVACTAYAMDGDAERFLAAGFDGYLSKPFTRPQLVRIVQAFTQV